MPAKPPRVRQQLALLQPGAVREVVRADADERERGVGRPVAVGPRRAARLERDHGVLPREPVGHRPCADVGVRALEQPRVRGDEIAVPVRLRHAAPEAVPVGREEAAHPAVEPVDVRAPGHRDAEEDDLRHALGVPLGVGEDQRRPPRAAVEEPPLDAEVLAQPLHVGDEVVGRVRRHVDRGVARVREAAAAATLVEQDDAVSLRVEVAAASRAAAGAGPTVHDEGRLPGRVATRLPVDEVVVAHVEQPLVVRLDGGNGSIRGSTYQVSCGQAASSRLRCRTRVSSSSCGIS